MIGTKEQSSFGRNLVLYKQIKKKTYATEYRKKPTKG